MLGQDSYFQVKPLSNTDNMVMSKLFFKLFLKMQEYF